MNEEAGAARVLVVEDDAAIVKAMTLMLEHAGYEVRCAQNGAVGLELVITFRPEVVVFDFWMPVADGREFLMGMREVAKARVGLVAISGTPEVEEWCGRVGITQFVRKPFTNADLTTAVARALDEAKTHPSRPRISDPPTSRRLRLERAVLVVGETEAVRVVRSLLREGERPMQVAVVQEVEDAVRALTSISVDAIAVCGSAVSSPHLIHLVAESAARKIPVILEGRSSLTLPDTAGVHVCSEPSARAIADLIAESVRTRDG